jgi:hypothetical protein
MILMMSPLNSVITYVPIQQLRDDDDDDDNNNTFQDYSSVKKRLGFVNSARDRHVG